MAKLVLDNLKKRYSAPGGNTVVAVQGINLTVEDGEFMVLIGPSGCGKTSTLRMIAGLEECSGGSISIDGVVVNNVRPKDRDIAMVFQNYALYPHLSVFENMAFGLRMRKMPYREIVRRVGDASVLLGLTDYLDRKPQALSGGQRQRVAVGRAIVRQPKVFLFDEPLSNLDAKLRVSTRTEITRLHARLGATMIYVTHDQVEAMTMGDRICVMNEGRIMQVADPLTLYNEPANMFVAGFIGAPPMNFIVGTISRHERGLYFVERTECNVAGFRLEIGNAAVKLDAFADRSVVLGIRPEDIRRTPLEKPIQGHTISAEVESCEMMGAEAYLYLKSAGAAFVARVKPEDRQPIGATETFTFNIANAKFFHVETQDAIR